MKDAHNLGSAAYNILTYAEGIPYREGIKETPERFQKAFADLLSGYDVDPKDVLKTFEEECYGAVIMREIPFYSLCEHHLLPFFGTVNIGIIPDPDKRRIVGLSKYKRLVDVFSKRLQVQERITKQIADALRDNLDPYATFVSIRARHMCMEMRGVCANGAFTDTEIGTFRYPYDVDRMTEFGKVVRHGG